MNYPQRKGSNFARPAPQRDSTLNSSQNSPLPVVRTPKNHGNQQSGSTKNIANANNAPQTKESDTNSNRRGGVPSGPPTPLDSLRSTRVNVKPLPQKKIIPVVRENNERMIKEYYNSFMEGHFLYDETTNTASKKLKERLLRLQDEIVAKSSQSTRVSPNRSTAFGRDERLSETRFYDRGDFSRLLNPQAESPFDQGRSRLDLQHKPNMPTFYMIDKNEDNRQTKLGRVSLPQNGNMLEKHKFLIDPKNLMQMSAGVIQKKLIDIRKVSTIRQLQEQHNQLMSEGDKTTKSGLSTSGESTARKRLVQKLGISSLNTSDIAQFKDENREYVDARKQQMFNPMRTGDITFTEIRAIDKMKAMRRWHEKQPLKRLDSLVESIYNSEKNLEWRNYRPESRDKLYNSEASEEEFDLFRDTDSGGDDDEDELVNDPDFNNLGQTVDNVQEEIKLRKKQEDLEKKKQDMLASLKSSPRTVKRNMISGMNFAIGGTPISHDKVEIAGIHIASIKENGPVGVLFKSREQAMRLGRKLKNKYITEIFRHYCNELQIAAVKFLNYYSDGILHLHNYNIQQNLCIAIACTIPYLIDLEGIKFKNNGIKDECAALLLKACSLCPKFRIFHFEKNEVSQEFVDTIKELVDEQPDQIQELNLSSSKNFSKVVSKLCEAIKDDFSLTCLDLSNNNLDAISCKHIGYMLRHTQNLQQLNLSYCGIRGHSSRIVLNSLLLNNTVKYLNLCWNSFASLDYEFGSKLARIIQVHPQLIHVDLTCTQLKREETMYIAQCLKDSLQIVSCHLTGNHVDYYSRIFLRAHLNAIVQYPNKTNTTIQNIILAHDRAQIIGLNQIIQSNFNVAPQTASNQEPNSIQPHSANHMRSHSQAQNGSGGQSRGRQVEQRDDSYFYGPRGSSQGLQYNQHPKIKSSEMNVDNLENQGNDYQNFKYNFSSETSQETEVLEDEEVLPINLRRYLHDDQSRIYDMIHMFDVYARRFQDRERKANPNWGKGPHKYSVPPAQLDINALQEQLKQEDQEKISNAEKQMKAGVPQDSDFQKAMNVIFQAYDDKLLANPMQGFLKELVFARYLGHSEIENGLYWRDCNQCWVCEKWDKVKIDFSQHDAISDLRFEKLQDKLFKLRQEEKLKQRDDLNPVNEEQFESLDDEYDQKKAEVDRAQQEENFHNGHGLSRKQQSMGIKLEGGQRLVHIGSSQGQLNKDNSKGETEQANPKRRSTLANMSAIVNGEEGDTIESRQRDFRNQLANQPQQAQVPQTYDQNIVTITEKGPIDLKIQDLVGKNLYNASIFPVLMNVEKVQKLIVPTFGLQHKPLGAKEESSQVVMSEGLVPYKPFTKIQPHVRESHVIKLPNIYSSLENNNKNGLAQPDSSIDSTDVRPPNAHNRPQQPSTNANTALNSRQNSRSKLVVNTKFDDLLNLDPEVSPLAKRTPRIRTKNEILKMNQDLIFNLESIPDTDDVYLVASFNHWFPVKMDITVKKKILLKDEQSKKDKLLKDQKQLLMVDMPDKLKRKHQQVKSRARGIDDDTGLNNNNEVYKTLEKEEEQLYEKEKVKIENLFKYINFLPSGKHFFYFIRAGKYYALSDKFAVRRFKGTNLYMNEIVVQKREWAISEVQPRTKDALDPNYKFAKDKSIFKGFKEEDEDMVRRMFELDFSNTKVTRIVKNNEQELQCVKDILWENYNRLRNIFLTLITASEYPIISWNDFTIFCNKCKVVDKNVNLSIIDTIYIATNVVLNSQQQADRDLCRYEFLEILVRLANEKYKKPQTVQTISQALQKFLEENLYPNIEETDAISFRKTHLYTFFVNELLVRNEVGLKKLFGLFVHGQKRYLTYKDAIELINTKAELRFLDKQVVKQFALSKMTHFDIVKDPSFPNRMGYVEFLEFLGRIAFEIFKDHEAMQNEPLHLKIDALLTKLFKIVKFTKAFTYLEYQKQNVVYEVVLNPQLAAPTNLERQLSLDKFVDDKLSDVISVPSARPGNNQ